jgi:hypothetical protein
MDTKVVKIDVARVDSMFEPIEAFNGESHTHYPLPLWELDDTEDDSSPNPSRPITPRFPCGSPCSCTLPHRVRYLPHRLRQKRMFQFEPRPRAARSS